MGSFTNQVPCRDADPWLFEQYNISLAQPALNLCKEADEIGLWKQYNCRMIGVDVAAIDTAEDREKFRQLMVKCLQLRQLLQMNKSFIGDFGITDI